jgi:hypothetical protein
VEVAPGVWNVVDGKVDGDSTAEQCLASARLLRRTVCEAVRRMVPALAEADDTRIEAEFQQWSEYRWRRTAGVLDVCPVPQPAWVETLRALDEAAERAWSEGSFEYGRTPNTEMMEAGMAAFGVVRWLEFWGGRGHGFLSNV